MSNKRQKKRAKKKPQISAKQAWEARRQRVLGIPAPTPNAKMIRDLMLSQRISANYKDYVVIAGRRIIDWQDSYDMVTTEGKTVGANGVALIHKSKLANILGDELARLFWRPGIGRVNTKKKAG